MNFAPFLNEQYGLHLCGQQKSAIGAGSDTWFLHCTEGEYILKMPSATAINHPEREPELCAFLRAQGIPACDFLKNASGSYLSMGEDGRMLTVQRRLPGITPDWHTASETVLLESAEMLGRIHQVLAGYPPLPEGIGAAFFNGMTPQRAALSYQRSYERAVQAGHRQNAEDLAFRIDLMAHFPDWQFDVDKLTCRNTHGDYFISQFLCENGHLTAVIDWTTACIHPVIWEVMRSFVYAAPCCADGTVDRTLLKRYLEAYCRYGTLNDTDLKNLERLYFYQIAVCDYYGQYYDSQAANRGIYLQQARFATRMLKHIDDVAQQQINPLL